MAFINASIFDSTAPLKDVKRVQFGILGPDEIVIKKNEIVFWIYYSLEVVNKKTCVDESNARYNLSSVACRWLSMESSMQKQARPESQKRAVSWIRDRVRQIASLAARPARATSPNVPVTLGTWSSPSPSSTSAFSHRSSKCSGVSASTAQSFSSIR